jgi:hypothetical protein
MPFSHLKYLPELTFKTLVFLDDNFLFNYLFFDFLLFFCTFLRLGYAFLILFFFWGLFSLLFFHFFDDLISNFLRNWDKLFFGRIITLPRSKYISAIKHFAVSVIRIFVFAFLLEIREIRVVVNCFVEIVNILIWNYFRRASK